MQGTQKIQVAVPILDTAERIWPLIRTLNDPAKGIYIGYPAPGYLEGRIKAHVPMPHNHPDSYTHYKLDGIKYYGKKVLECEATVATLPNANHGCELVITCSDADWTYIEPVWRQLQEKLIQLGYLKEETPQSKKQKSAKSRNPRYTMPMKIQATIAQFWIDAVGADIPTACAWADIDVDTYNRYKNAEPAQILTPEQFKLAAGKPIDEAAQETKKRMESK